MALYSVRSERLFCEQLGYNLLWLWFLDRQFSQGSFNYSGFAKNYQRVLSADVAQLFFAEVYAPARQHGWSSDEHFSADGTPDRIVGQPQELCAQGRERCTEGAGGQGG